MKFSSLISCLFFVFTASYADNITSTVYLSNGSLDYGYWAQSKDGSHKGSIVPPAGTVNAPSVKQYSYSDPMESVSCDLGSKKYTHTIWIVANQGIYNTVICSYDEIIKVCEDYPFHFTVKISVIPTQGFVPNPPESNQLYIDTCMVEPNSSGDKIYFNVISHPNPGYNPSSQTKPN